MRAWRESVTPQQWLTSGACVTVLVYAVAGVAALGLVQQAREWARVPRGTVTGRAAAALGDSAAFAMPSVPTGVRPVIALADAESAAVAMGYRWAPSYQVIGRAHYQERPTELRRLCGRSYYVRSVVALPDSLVVQSSVTSDFVAMWGPAWVVPVCDDAGVPRTTVLLADAPTRLRVVLGDQPGDVPELVFPRDPFTHIGSVDPQRFRAWDRGIALAPETAVAVAAAQLADAEARVTEVPQAFMTVVPPPPGPPQHSIMNQTLIQTHACPRWRLTLDRAVTLRGIVSGQAVRTRTVYVARGDGGCDGAPALQIPRPTQPMTLPFHYGVRLRVPDAEAAPRGARSADLPSVEFRSAALRVTEPIWFEGARLSQ